MVLGGGGGKKTKIEEEMDGDRWTDRWIDIERYVMTRRK